LPIGSFEQHGSFLPLTTDTVVASAIGATIAASHNVLLLPPITISCSHEHAAWPGTVSISHQTLSAIVDDISSSLRQRGIEKLVLLNGHGGNYVLSNVVQTANVSRPQSMTIFPGRLDWDTARTAADLQTDAHSDMHAGELETSILLHVWPDAVGPDYLSSDHLAEDRSLLLVKGMTEYTNNGVIGLPSAATSKKGQAILESLAISFGSHLGDLLAESDQ
jgi:creatinine amidohydrolase